MSQTPHTHLPLTPTPLIATSVVRRAAIGAALVIDTVTLDRASRYRRRIALTSDGGQALLLDLPEATYLADGDALAVETGVIVVRAAAEPLMEVHAPSPQQLARIAWHIGNRHTPAEIADGAIYLLRDHVLQQMIEGLGGHVHHVTRPFQPEGGAYGGHASMGGGHGHHHHHAVGSDHSHGHGSPSLTPPHTTAS